MHKELIERLEGVQKFVSNYHISVDQNAIQEAITALKAQEWTPAVNIELTIVHGSTGEYSDRSEWPVAAFYSEQAAKAYIEKLETVYHGFQQTRCGFERPPKEKELLLEKMRKIDPRFDEDYTGTYWFLNTLAPPIPGE